MLVSRWKVRLMVSVCIESTLRITVMKLYDYHFPCSSPIGVCSYLIHDPDDCLFVCAMPVLQRCR